jgi:UPF0271 protein
MGESFGAWTMGADKQAMAQIHRANIACGFHAGSPDVMDATVALAARHGVIIGAHPGYDDKAGFGRRAIAHSMEQITCLLRYQIGALQGICAAHKTQVQYVKPHGSLYNEMMSSEAIFIACLAALQSFELPLDLMILACPQAQRYSQLAADAGITLLFEAFADRRYQDNGQLMPRSKPGAVLHDPAAILDQVALLAKEGLVITESGNRLPLRADTLCVHGDNPESIALIEKIRKSLP